MRRGGSLAFAATADLDAVARRIGLARRIHIIGGPGSGKSTLARHLGAELDLPVHMLDTVAYEGPEFTARPFEVSARHAREIAESSEWISEGIFLGWTDPLLRAADMIVWLDHVGWTTAAARIIERFLRSAIDEAHVRPASERFFRFADYRRNLRHLVVVLIVSREYWAERRAPRRYPVTREQVRGALEPYAQKVVRITSSRDALVFEALPVSRSPQLAEDPSPPSTP